VSFGNDRFVGDPALSQCAKNPLNTVYDAKRLMGKNFSDPLVQKDLKNWPFKVESGPNDKPQIVVKHKDQTKRFYPE
jgi:heat shock protein 1/8